MNTAVKVLIVAAGGILIGETIVQMNAAAGLKKEGVLVLRYERVPTGTEKIYGKILMPDGSTPQPAAQVTINAIWINNAGGIIGGYTRQNTLTDSRGEFTIFVSTMDLSPLPTSPTLPFSGWQLIAGTTDYKRNNRSLISIKSGFNTYIEMVLKQIAEVPPIPGPGPGPGPGPI